MLGFACSNFWTTVSRNVPTPPSSNTQNFKLTFWPVAPLWGAESSSPPPQAAASSDRARTATDNPRHFIAPPFLGTARGSPAGRSRRVGTAHDDHAWAASVARVAERPYGIVLRLGCKYHLSACYSRVLRVFGPLGGFWLDQVVGLAAEVCSQPRVPPGPSRLISKNERIGERIQPGSVRFADVTLESVRRPDHLANPELKCLVHRPIAEGDVGHPGGSVASQCGLDPEDLAAPEPARRFMNDLDVG